MSIPTMMRLPLPDPRWLGGRQRSTAAAPAVAAALAALLTLVGSAVARAEDTASEPYVVFVADEAVYARCGPDGEYYRTDPLRLGQELEVHLETDDGWLGIRPPENSFSWIPAASVQRIDGADTARVIDRQAVAWIGTSLGRARKYRWQIQLSEGEEVVIVGQSQREGDEGTQRWYRIVPPSGEFRWVHRSQVVDSAEKLVQQDRGRQRRGAEASLSVAAADSQETIADRPDRRSDRQGSATELAARSDSGRRDAQRSGDASNGRTDADQWATGPAAATPLAGDAAADQSPTDADGDGRPGAAGSQTLQATLRGIADAFHVDGRPVGSGLAPAAASRTPDQPAVVLGDNVVLRDILAAPAAQPSPSGTALDTGEMLAGDSRWTSGVRPATATSVEPAPGGPATTADQYAAAPATAAQPAAAAALTPTAPPLLQQIDHEDPAQVQALAARIASADVAQLQLELSRQMAAGASANMVQPIRQRAADWLQQLTDATDRGRARLLLERAEQYQRVAQRRSGQSDVLPPMASESHRSTAAPVEAAEVASAAAEANAESAPADAPPDFDRRGYLVQVYSARPDSPPFALTDASGRTLAYVSPAPGLNLRRYLNTQVGLYGQLSYHTGLETPHLIAQRAVQTSR